MTTMEMKLELVLVPVTDVDRAKAFYTEKLGFHADFDQTVNENLRFVQLTPPGSACSIAIGKGITSMQPGSIEGLIMVISDAKAAREELLQRGADVSDPDGNRWSLQQLPKRT
jgi:catechol 2,3-dioxygenase-like lactoylglutathione lyase family enzyme